MGNTDTVTKRVTVIVRSAGWDDLAICNFYLPASQSPASYTMRTHTTTSWANATIDFYAADVNGGSSTGAYQLDNVVLSYRPGSSSAATECVNPHAPTSGGTTSGNLIANGDFGSGTDGWSLAGSSNRASPARCSSITGRRGARRRLWRGRIGAVAASQRLAAVFEMGNTSSSRQRVMVSLQAADARKFMSCVFWLPAGTPRRAYAMTTAAPVSWSPAAFTVAPSNGGTESSHGWLQLDTVSVNQITTSIVGTGCYEPGSFTVDEEGAPAPVPAPVALNTPASVTAAIALTRSALVAPAPVLSPAAAVAAVERPDGGAPPPMPAVTWTASIVGTGSGTIASSPGGINCAGYDVSCAGLFPEGSTVTFTATPATGHTFGGWGGACAGVEGPSCEVFIAGAQSVIATFNGPTTLRYYHTDVLGSVRAVTSATGAPIRNSTTAPSARASRR